MRRRRNQGSILDVIRPGMRVTIVNRFGQQRSGKAVMRGRGGWVLNMGGPHGTPGIATPENIVKVTDKEKPSLFGGRIVNPRVRFKVGDSVSVPWFGKRMHDRAVQIKAGGRMVVDDHASGLHDVPTKFAHKIKGRGKKNPAGALHYFMLSMYDSEAQRLKVSPHTMTRLLPSVAAAKAWAQEEVDEYGGVGYLYKDTRQIAKIKAARANPGPSALPSKWTRATVTRKGGKIQIRIGGRR